jgi:hypothetical protein
VTPKVLGVCPLCRREVRENESHSWPLAPRKGGPVVHLACRIDQIIAEKKRLKPPD